ncbi:MAG: class I SAM-dependent methyltransferase [Anaerolineae bacterium]|nr:class I SAM-dependent methyltransferase [Anaerolineae bacterium]
MTGWYENDDFWKETIPVMFGPQAWDDAPQQAKSILERVGMEPSVQVLDLPCGVGRHSLAFAYMGCQVTGVDRTSLYLDEALRRTQEAGLNIEFVQADMREFVRPESYDLAINLFTSFGYFEDQADDMKVLANFYRSLRPGGVLVMDMMGKENLARIFRPRDWRELEDGTLVLEEREVTRNWTWMENRWILIKGGQRRDFSLSHRLYSAAELARLLELAGFEQIDFFGDLAGAPYHYSAQRLVAVARRCSVGDDLR